ncbi:MAG: periplasmic heavy metal sensor [Desulfobacterales bacterium]|jgi:Spy/CpxP family protein refolding chaperone
MMKKTLAILLLPLAVGLFSVPDKAWAAESSSAPGMSQEKQSQGAKMGKMMGQTEPSEAYEKKSARWHHPEEWQHQWRRGWAPGWHPRRYSHRVVIAEITGNFHYWLGCLMAEREDLDLSADQSQKLDKVLTDYSKNLIDAEAAALSEMVQLKYDLRQPKVDMPAVQTKLKDISEHEYAIQLSAIKTYQSILDILTPPQRQKVDELIGSAFPSIWHPMRRWNSGYRHEWKSEKHEEDED